MLFVIRLRLLPHDLAFGQGHCAERKQIFGKGILIAGGAYQPASALLHSLGTGTEQHITITSSSNMSKEDIEKAVKDAEQYAAEDAKIKEKVEVRNQADQMVYQSEKTLGEVGDKIPADEKAKVQSGIDKLKEVLKGDDTDAIKSATEELTQMFYQMSEKLYQQANPQGGAQAGPDMGGQNGGAQTGPNGQQYYDADYKVVDDDDNNKK